MARTLRSVSHYLWCDGPRHLGKETEHSLREGLVGDVVLQQQHLLLCLLIPCIPQTAHKVALTKKKSLIYLHGLTCCFCAYYYVPC